MSITSTSNAMLLLGANGTNPFKTTDYPDLSKGWWNNATTPQTDSYNGYQFQKYGTQAPTFQTYGTAAPTYTGLSDGAYGRLEQSLANPGLIAARNAYKQNTIDATAAAGGKGTYGSSPYTQQLTNQIGKNYADTVATNAANAASTRYGMQQKDLQFGTQTALDAWKSKLAENMASNNQAYNAWNAGLQQNNLMNQLGQQDAQYGANFNYSKNLYDANFQNQLKQALWNAQLGQAQWNSDQTNQVYNRAMNWGQNTDELNDSLKAQTISKMANQSSGGSLGGIGSLAGGLLGDSGVGGLLSGLGGLGSLFGGGADAMGSFLTSGLGLTGASSLGGLGAGAGGFASAATGAGGLTGLLGLAS